MSNQCYHGVWNVVILRFVSQSGVSQGVEKGSRCCLIAPCRRRVLLLRFESALGVIEPDGWGFGDASTTFTNTSDVDNALNSLIQIYKCVTANHAI